jgi:predicted RNA binding protein YcfA (HicA-like mRNA interferase family)
MKDIIKRLLDLGHAYVAEDGKHVFFAVASDKNYGLLAGRKTEDMIAGARVSVKDIKEVFVVSGKPESIQRIQTALASKGLDIPVKTVGTKGFEK